MQCCAKNACNSIILVIKVTNNEKSCVLYTQYACTSNLKRKTIFHRNSRKLTLISSETKMHIQNLLHIAHTDHP